METTLFISSADGKYETLPLPPEVQYAPVHAIKILDYDRDGRMDLVGLVHGGPPLFLRNTSPATGHWLRINLRPLIHSS